jgi:hypothetical protein
MQIEKLDISDYLDTRRRMRLLPNLLDFGIAYGVFRPVVNIMANLKPLARSVDMAVPAWLFHQVTTDPFVFVGGALVYAVFALFVAAFNGSLGTKFKTLVLSDSTKTIWVFLILFSLWALAFFPILKESLSKWAFLTAIPGIFVYACARYLWLLRGLRNHPSYRHLVGVQRRSFAYSTVRYDFMSHHALSVYWSTIRNSGKLALAYLAIALYVFAIMILSQAIPEEDPNQWLQTAPKWLVIAIGVVAILLFAQPIAYARRFVSNAWFEWTRILRANLARSASELSLLDERPPILFLRSFRDDRIQVESERFWGHAFLGLKDRRVRLEEVLAETLYAHGPIVALSNPQDALPPLGAARKNVANENWQDDVGEFMDQAAWIVFVVGSTRSLRWEISQILERGYIEKTLVVFPPAYHDSSTSGRLLVKALPELASALGILTEEAEREVLDGALLVAWKDTSNALIIRQAGDGEARGYSDAVRLAIATCATTAADWNQTG